MYKSIEDLPMSLKVVDVAKALNISKSNAYTLVHSENFPKITLGSRLIIPKDAFIRWFNSQIPEQFRQD